MHEESLTQTLHSPLFFQSTFELHSPQQDLSTSVWEVRTSGDFSVSVILCILKCIHFSFAAEIPICISTRAYCACNPRNPAGSGERIQLISGATASPSFEYDGDEDIGDWGNQEHVRPIQPFWFDRRMNAQVQRGKIAIGLKVDLSR